MPQRVPAQRCPPAWIVAALTLAGSFAAAADDPPPNADAASGYLFAHMLASDYGRLYYSASDDGRHWRLLNQGRRVLDTYLGHPDITRGHDGRFYMIGVQREPPTVGVWASPDLVSWEWTHDLDPTSFDVADFQAGNPWRGAPKLFYDERTGIYVMTWHATSQRPVKEDPERYWSGMRTFVVTSQNLRDFTPPQQLFPYDMATIDVILRRQDDHYVAILKDERYPSFEWPTGKTIRYATAEHLLGPYSEPSPPISTNFREAPTVIQRPDDQGFDLYFEQYPGVSYGLATAPALDGPWHGVYWNDYDVPQNARHGCMLRLDPDVYQAVLKAFDK